MRNIEIILKDTGIDNLATESISAEISLIKINEIYSILGTNILTSLVKQLNDEMNKNQEDSGKIPHEFKIPIYEKIFTEKKKKNYLLSFWRFISLSSKS